MFNRQPAPQVVYVQRQKSPGMMLAIFGAVFGVLGIITFGFIFFWFALACTLLALVRAIAGLNAVAIGVCMINVALIGATVYTSPILWVHLFQLTH